MLGAALAGAGWAARGRRRAAGRQGGGLDEPILKPWNLNIIFEVGNLNIIF